MSESSPFRPKARRPRGFQDRRGALMESERALIERVSGVYEAWGFERLDTSAFEYADALGKFLPDQDRPNEGVFSLTDDDDQWMSLRYDLTAPLARFVAENYDGLPKPYRRWAAGPVWRNEKPGPGRFREFWQCDADTVGAPGPEADAEMIAMACAALEAAGVARGSYRLKFSTRRLLDAVLEAAGVAGDPVKSLRVLRAIDKLDRLGREGVGLLLGAGRRDESGDFTPGAELDEGQRAIVLGVFGSEPSAAQAAPRSDAIGQMVQRIGDRSAKFEGAIAEFVAIDAILGRLGVSQVQAAIDPSIVRGLEYYTGPVFEAELLAETVDENGNKIRFGSVGGGGRYDDLVSRFRGEKIPATGFSIGVSRLAAALAAGERGENAQAQGPVVVLPFDKEGMAECFALAASVRAAGMAAEVYLGGSGPKAQLRYADKRNAPAAVILGGDERAAGQVTIKDLKLGAALSKQVADNREWREGRQAQVTVAQADMIPTLQRMLQP